MCLLSSKKRTLCYYFYMIRIQEIRKRMRKTIAYRPITQKKPGISPRTVGKYADMKSLPRTDIFANLCKTLGVSVREILTGEK